MSDWKQYLSRFTGSVDRCHCGRIHSQSIKYIDIGPGAVECLGEYCCRQSWYHLTVVADPITYEVGFARVEGALEALASDMTTIVLGEKEHAPLVPDEAVLGRLIMEIPPDTDVLIALGSGTINDLVRYAAARLQLPFISVPTAPSMDGYASSVAPLHVGQFKKTFPATAPEAIFADTEIFATAPAIMIAAGFGDIVGKITARADWYISHIITGEQYCETPLQLMDTALNQCLSNAERIGQKDQKTLESLMEALILSGVAIMLNGNSRPASGPEHLLAHYWEVRHGLEGKSDALHGVKVGVATPIAIAFMKKLFGHDFTAFRSKPYPNYSQREELIRAHYRDAAESVMGEGRKKWVPREQLQAFRSSIERNWKLMQELVNKLPDPCTVGEWLEASGCPIRIDEIGVSCDELRDALLYAKEMRARFTVFDLADYLGCLQDIIAETMEELSRQGFISVR